MAISCLVVHAIKMWLASFQGLAGQGLEFPIGNKPTIKDSFWVPSWNSASFSKFSLSFPSPTLYKIETHKKKKKIWIHESNVVCWLRGEVGLMWIGKRPRNEKCPTIFNHDCSYDLPDTNANGSFLHWDKEKFMKSEAILEILMCFVDGAYNLYVSGMSLALKSCRNASRVFFFLAFESSWWLSHLFHGTISFEEFLLLLVVVENESVQ